MYAIDNDTRTHYTVLIMTYAFNMTFTRDDEQHAHTYTVGFNVKAGDRTTAEHKLREFNDHLTITNVVLYAIMNDEGYEVDGA